MSKLPSSNKIKEFFKNLFAALFVILIIMIIGYFGGKEIEDWKDMDNQEKEWLEDMQKLDERLKRLEEQKTSSIEIKPVIAEMTTEEIITKVCKEEGVNPTVCLRIASCESSMNPEAIHNNGRYGRDIGIFQWNEYFHPELVAKCQFDVECQTREFCKAVKQGHLDWWKCAEKIS